MDYYLLLDTSSALSFVALANEQGIVDVLFNEDSSSQAAKINVMIAELMGKHHIEMYQLVALGLCSGPGSYTGLRISYSVVKGIAYALDIPVVAVNRLEVIAQNMHSTSAFVVAQKAREGEYFYANYDAEKVEILTPVHQTEAVLLQLLNTNATMQLFTDHSLHYEQEVVFEPGDVFKPEFFYLIFKRKLEAELLEDIAYCEPMYLKSVYVTTPKKSKLL